MLKIIINENIKLGDDFIKNDIDYNLVYRILEDKNAFIVQSKDLDFLAVQNNGKPMWVWMKSNLDSMKEKEYIKQYFKLVDTSGLRGVIGYKNIVEKITNEMSRIIKEKHEMISYYCPKVVLKRNFNYDIKKSTYKDIKELVVLIDRFTEETFGNSNLKESEKLAENIINEGNLYHIKINNKIVSIANIVNKSKKYGRINYVYTLPNNRNKGIATYMVAKLSNNAINDGIIPVLYTHDQNMASNKSYKNVGFIEVGRITHIKFC